MCVCICFLAACLAFEQHISHAENIKLFHCISWFHWQSDKPEEKRHCANNLDFFMYISDLVWHDVSETGAGFQFSNKISMNENDLCRKCSLCFANSSEKMRIYFYLYFMIALSIDNAFETSNRVPWKNWLNKRKSNKLTM